MTRVGLIGLGFIGSQVYERVCAQPDLGLEVAFVHNRSPGRLQGVPAELVLEDLAQSPGRRADLVVEMAHPEYTRRYGEHFLSHSDYLPLSVTALADDGLRERLRGQAQRSGRHLYIPRGALMGTEDLLTWRHMWEQVEITFIKNPQNIDFSESDFDPGRIIGETVVYDGPARGIARLYPRNVNTMITCALATVGLDRCRARLIASPGLNVAIAEVKATGRDGAKLEMRKTQPMSGVSGTELIESQFRSILRAAGAAAAMDFV